MLKLFSAWTYKLALMGITAFLRGKFIIFLAPCADYWKQVWNLAKRTFAKSACPVP